MPKDSLMMQELFKLKRYEGRITYEEFKFIADSDDTFERKAWRINEKCGISYRQAHRWVKKYAEEMRTQVDNNA